MSITDELRKEARGFGYYIYTAEQAEHLTAIADRIDAEHERVRAESILDMTDERMAEHGWVRLPKDADGVPIHVGDVMEWIDIEGEVTLTCEVAAVGVECFFAWDKANGRYAQKSASVYRHYHAPTVEDVLREFFARYVTTKPKEEDDAIIAEYAAKLRLTEGEDA